MTEEIIKAALLLVGTALTVWGTISVSRRSEKTQRRKEDAEAQAQEQSRLQSVEDSLWQRMEKKLSEQDAKIQTLTARLDESERARGQQAREIRDLQDRERDRAELISDYREHVLAWDLYIQSGSVPPPPVHSWRIRADLEQAKKEVG